MLIAIRSKIRVLKPPFTLHSYFLAAFPVISFVSQNYGDVRLTQAIPSLFGVLVVATLFLSISQRICGRNTYRAAVLTSFYLVIFSSYGHVLLFLRSVSFDGLQLGRHRFILPLALLIMLLGTWLIVEHLAKPLAVTRPLNIVGLVLVSMPIVTLIGTLRNEFSSFRAPLTGMGSGVGVPREVSEELPDIYYIILDGYGRNDVLHDLYSFDNDSFLATLEELGFYVGTQSYSNYNRTVLSLGSSLNQNYIQYYLDEDGEKPSWNMVLSLIRNNKVSSYLSLYDYKFVTFETGYSNTEIEESDYYISYNKKVGFEVWGIEFYLNEVELSLMSTSILSVMKDGLIKLDMLSSFNDPFDAHRIRVKGVFKSLGEIGKWDGHFFVFAHIISPHPPFVFDAEGRPANPQYPFTLLDGNEIEPFVSQDEYIEGYRDQIQYVNKLTLETIEIILSTSDVPPIIILQSDHGPGLATDFRSMHQTDLKERFAILNCYYIQGRDSEYLYNSISPVNSFRVVFNELFGVDMPMLEDRSYFAEDGISKLLLVPVLGKDKN